MNVEVLLKFKTVFFVLKIAKGHHTEMQRLEPHIAQGAEWEYLLKSYNWPQGQISWVRLPWETYTSLLYILLHSGENSGGTQRRKVNQLAAGSNFIGGTVLVLQWYRDTVKWYRGTVKWYSNTVVPSSTEILNFLLRSWMTRISRI